ncbi:MAG: hypothetical protein MRY83_09490 [Flavobacteriales bacterium]|nr:hypothetical protein [Flavobacteriales bacterium]
MIKKPLFLAICLLSIIVSCKKYEDGPILSLKTKNNRLKGTWVLLDEADFRNAQYHLIFDFEKSGKITYIENLGIPVIGTWEWSDDKEYILIDDFGFIYPYKILRLTKTDLWLEDINRWEYHFSKNK